MVKLKWCQKTVGAGSLPTPANGDSVFRVAQVDARHRSSNAYPFTIARPTSCRAVRNRCWEEGGTLMTTPQVVRRAQIEGVFTGFNDDMLFKLTDGTYWLQSEYRLCVHYAYRPMIDIIEHRGGLQLGLSRHSGTRAGAPDLFRR